MNKYEERVIRQRIERALKMVNKEISALAADGGKYAGAMSGEGYAGGYRDALSDVVLLLNDVAPTRRNYWDTT